MSSVNATTFYDVKTSAELANSDAAMRTPVQQLDQADFLKILVAQMTQQDPLSPSADLSSISQMASFSSLEQLRTMATQSREAAEQSRSMQADLAVLKANSLIGRTVETVVPKEDGSFVKGTVSAVLLEAGTPKVVVDDIAYGLEQLRTIKEP